LFMGIAELLASLLLFRRTATIGAIITLMTAANVMAINYFYDVPVKIVSTALVIMCLYLLLPNMGRLFIFFFEGGQTVLRTLYVPFAERWMRITKYTLKYLLIAFALFVGIIQIASVYSQYGDGAPKSPLYGAYKVDTFKTSNKSNLKKWDILFLSSPTNGAIKDQDGFEYLNIAADTSKKTMTFIFNNDPNTKYQLNYKKELDRLWLTGTLFGDTISVSSTKMKFDLVDRELNWINERPYNK